VTVAVAVAVAAAVAVVAMTVTVMVMVAAARLVVVAVPMSGHEHVRHWLRGVSGEGALAVAPMPSLTMTLCLACVAWLALLGFLFSACIRVKLLMQ
jgi:hypothetical protein